MRHDGIYRPFVRPLAAFLLFLLVVCAILQGLGRLGMWLLDDLEGSINVWLDGRASLDGLTGGWDGLNPVASVRHIELPAGSLAGVSVELDVFESIRRNRLVLERLLVDAAELAVEHTPAGWRLAGMEPADMDFDLARALGDIDEIRFDGRLAVLGATDQSLAVEVRGINRDGAHAYDLFVGGGDCVDSCRLDLHWRATDGTWLGRPEERYLAVSGGFALPGPFVDGLGFVSGLELRARGRWLERGDQGGGEFSLGLDRVGLPGGVLGALAAELRGTLLDGRREGVLAGVKLAAGEAELELQPVHFRNAPQGTDFWVGTLPLGELTDLLTVALGGVETAARWLAALKPGGALLNVHAGFHDQGLGYAATFGGLRLDAYKGVPWVREADGEIIGYDRGALLTLNSEALRAQVADVFEDRWRFENMQGNLHAWFGDGYIGMRAPYFRFETQGNRFSGAFALARPDEYFGQRVAMLINADRLGVEQSRTYIPYHLSDALRHWLREGPRAGEILAPRLAYQGQVHTEPNDRSRRLDIQAHFRAGELRYHEDWPLITAAQGFVELVGTETHAQVDFARTLGAEIRDSRVFLGDGGAFARVDLRADVETGDGLDFVRASPLAEWLTFVAPEWDGTGSLRLDGELFIPIGNSVSEPLDCRLDVELADVGLVLPDYRVALEHLHGPLQYRYPHYLTAAPLPVELFGRPGSVAAQADEGAIHFRFQGTAAPPDVYHLIDMSDPELATGLAPFDALLSFAVDDGLPGMTVTSNLVGLSIDLPGEFAKVAAAPRPSKLNLKFLDEYVVAQFQHGDLNGWLHVEEIPLRGAIGIRGPAPVIAPDTDEVVVSGRVREVDINEWMAGAGATDLPVPWRLADVAVDRVSVETLVFDDVLVEGHSRDGEMTLAFAGADLVGQLRSAGQEPLQLDFQSIRLPAPDGEGDPLEVAVINRLPDADVTVDSVIVGEEDFGNWSFRMRRHPDGVLVGDLRASLKDTEITAPEGVYWNASTNRSSGAVRLTMEDLAEVLPQWDFAPSLDAESAELDVDASWPGSPLNVEINGLRGDVSFRAKNGSFVEVAGGGALRILNLLNFNTILKRMSFNFKDVVAKGMSFDTVKARTRFDDGVLTFLEPAKVKGPGSDFKIGGSVNLVDGIMNDNEMIVTLPVGNSLPWYAVYVSLANPAAAVAVLAGQQVLKKQIKQLSSAKYQISGPWDDPEVKLVGIWNDDVQDFDELEQKPNVPGYPGETATEGGR